MQQTLKEKSESTTQREFNKNYIIINNAKEKAKGTI